VAYCCSYDVVITVDCYSYIYSTQDIYHIINIVLEWSGGSLSPLPTNLQWLVGVVQFTLYQITLSPLV